MTGSHPCGACGKGISNSPAWLCETCSAAWDEAIERQSGPSRYLVDRLEDAAIATYRAGRRR